jgi:hypothetical protein
MIPENRRKIPPEVENSKISSNEQDFAADLTGPTASRGWTEPQK